VLAFAVDLLLVNLVIACVGIVLAQATDGQVRVANTVLNIGYCSGNEPVSAGLVLPEGFTPTEARQCTRSLFGLTHDRYLLLSEKSIGDEDQKDVTRKTIALDAQGQQTDAFYLDDLTLPLLGLYLLLLEWKRGAAYGKRFAGVTVQSVSGGPIDFLQSFVRTFIRVAVLFVLESNSEIRASSEGYHISLKLVSLHTEVNFSSWFIVLEVIALAFAISFLVAMWRRSRPLHDYLARTDVVRVPLEPDKK